ncbi:MAG: Smr/MutS family protein [Gammaproteobacteria bacterium]|nr:Smr/MutS family protein [Gammaproteobacteria bacterium]
MGKESGKDSNCTDDKLFRDAMRDVKPIKDQRRHRAAPPPKPRASQRRASDQAVLQESLETPPAGADLETGEEISFRRAGLSERDYRKLRRGQFAVQDELDLHGLTAAEATDALRNFVAEASAAGNRCVRIVHGKGLGSGPGGPVLKKLVNRELRRWDPVLAFCSTQPRHGGTGAVYVLLRR